MPPSHKRAGFRVSIGVIAKSGAASAEARPRMEDRIASLLAEDASAWPAMESGVTEVVGIPIESTEPAGLTTTELPGPPAPGAPSS